jgi:ubiquinone/menaquinone biosynthesis C-methylase UbiE
MSVPEAPPGDWADHFSTSAADYARSRPRYPDDLFAWLASQAPARDRAWDAATGNGQAACKLADHFAVVAGSDASAGQLAAAPPGTPVHWLRCRCEAAALATGSMDLVTVAQALHWIAGEAFYGEVRRVTRPGALVAAWTYGLARIHPPVDAILNEFHDRVLGPWWPPRRRHVLEGYRSLPFPFTAIEPPPFTMTAHWSLDRLLSYLGTWSAVTRARRGTGQDPLATLQDLLRPAWGAGVQQRRITWPLGLRVGRRD